MSDICDTCKRTISYAEIGSTNPDNGQPICRRCVCIANGDNPDFKAQQLREKIDAIKRRRLPHARMEYGKAEGSNISSWMREIARLNDLLAEHQRQLVGLEV